MDACILDFKKADQLRVERKNKVMNGRRISEERERETSTQNQLHTFILKLNAILKLSKSTEHKHME